MIIMIILITIFIALLTGTLIQVRYWHYGLVYERDYCLKSSYELNEEEQQEKERVVMISDKYNEFACGIFAIFGIIVLIIIICLTFGICIRNTQYYRNSIRAEYEVQVAETQANCVAISNVKDVIAKANAIKEHNEMVRQYILHIKQRKIDLKNPFINWFVSDEWNELDENAFTFIEG